jgi:hypothetical protein
LSGLLLTSNVSDGIVLSPHLFLSSPHHSESHNS